jgi:hypothetical protein
MVIPGQEAKFGAAEEGRKKNVLNKSLKINPLTVQR